MAIGHRDRGCKVNANSALSPQTLPYLDEEWPSAPGVKYGADTVMDLPPAASTSDFAGSCATAIIKPQRARSATAMHGYIIRRSTSAEVDREARRRFDFCHIIGEALPAWRLITRPIHAGLLIEQTCRWREGRPSPALWSRRRKASGPVCCITQAEPAVHAAR